MPSSAKNRSIGPLWRIERQYDTAPDLQGKVQQAVEALLKHPHADVSTDDRERQRLSEHRSQCALGQLDALETGARRVRYD